MVVLTFLRAHVVFTMLRLKSPDFEGPRFKTILPHSSGNRISFGLTYGYLILFNREIRDLWLVNPITRHELHFSDYPLYAAVHEEGKRAFWAIRGILVF
uniref:Uncharacterized protein n=1 Tax=Lactuca sativa TaxID=4236 RepID=A0A9R1X6A1_LACSA|nr:hypothetical protein LSAT_V11C700358960 [Lactuca sativa]